MREARAKLRLIKPEDMDMEEYMVPSLGWTDKMFDFFMQEKHHKYANKEISIIFKQIFDEKMSLGPWCNMAVICNSSWDLPPKQNRGRHLLSSFTGLNFCSTAEHLWKISGSVNRFVAKSPHSCL